MATPLLRRCSVFAAKVEAAAGTPETLAAADGEYNVTDFELLEETVFNKRQGQGSFSPVKGHPGRRVGRATFRTELNGQGVTGGSIDWADVLLKACGFSESGGVYTPLSCTATPTTVTIGHFEDGRLRRLAGAMGNVTFNFTAGEPIVADWEFLGAYVAPSSLAKITPAYPSAVSPRFAGATLTIGGDDIFKIMQLQIAMNIQLTERPDGTATSGSCGSIITGRDISITMDPEAVAYGTKDWNPDWIDSTEQALQIIVNGGALNTIQFDCPKIQLQNPPNPTDRDGIYADQLVFQPNRDSDAGDDEMTITIS